MGEEYYLKYISWIRCNSPLTEWAVKQLPEGREKIACCIHLDEKMVGFFEGLISKGFKVAALSCNPKTVNCDVINSLEKIGVEIYCNAGMSEEERLNMIRKCVLNWNPTLLIDMGGSLITEAICCHYHDDEPGSSIIGCLEATQSGVISIKNCLEKQSLPWPVFNWDEIEVKKGIHNRRMVGLTAFSAFLHRTGLSFHMKDVLVLGYGLVGEGCVESAKHFGAESVTVYDPDPSKLVTASFAGVQISSEFLHALSSADVIVTATGCSKVITSEHAPLLRKGAFLINVGHHNDEIDATDLRSRFSNQEVLDFVEKFTVAEDRYFYLFAGGALANLAAGKGDSINAFDFTLALMIMGISYLLKEGSTSQPSFSLLPKSAWYPLLHRVCNRANFQ